MRNVAPVLDGEDGGHWLWGSAVWGARRGDVERDGPIL